MLVLTRKPGQSIIIGDGIEVEVLSLAREKVRLGITAPREVDVFRDEVHDRIQSERNAEAGADSNGGASGAPDSRQQRQRQQRQRSRR